MTFDFFFQNFHDMYENFTAFQTARI